MFVFRCYIFPLIKWLTYDFFFFFFLTNPYPEYSVADIEME